MSKSQKDEMTEPTTTNEAKITTKEDKATSKSKPVAKAGKRSAKGISESEIKLKKTLKADKTSLADEEHKATKLTKKPTRSKLERRSKNYRAKSQEIDKNKVYKLQEAAELIIKTNPTKFDATVEIHIRLNVDPRQADQNIRDSLFLPAGSGKNIRVAAFVDNENIDIAKKAGAELVGESSLTKELNDNNFIFDIVIATPNMMPKLGKYARILGPRGLMPNPKSGTVTTDVAKAIKDAKSGKIEYKVDSNGIVHLGIGKVSFTTKQIIDNIEAVISNVKGNKPASIKAEYISSIYLTTTMGPSIKLEV